MRKWLILLVVVVLAAPLLFRLALVTVLFTVDRTEFAYVTQFGRHVATYNGANDAEAGLHWRWPWPVQSVLSLDRRLQFFDLPGAELLTHDPRGDTIDRTLTIVAYVCWRIADADDGVDRFIRRVGNAAQARAILGQRISSQFGAIFGQREIDDFISTRPHQVEETMQAVCRQLMNDLRGRAREEYGIDLVDIRLRRHNYPTQVRQDIFNRIRSEREKKAAEYRSEGEQLAARIKSEAERDARNIVTEARAQEQELKGRADADADRVRNAAHSKDPEFYAFLKKLEEYQRILADNKTVLLLSAHRDLFDLLFHPPQPGSRGGSGKPVADTPPAKSTTAGGP
jgi:membrane protease subunit HflC